MDDGPIANEFRFLFIYVCPKINSYRQSARSFVFRPDLTSDSYLVIRNRCNGMGVAGGDPSAFRRSHSTVTTRAHLMTIKSKAHPPDPPITPRNQTLKSDSSESPHTYHQLTSSIPPGRSLPGSIQHPTHTPHTCLPRFQSRRHQVPP